MYNFKPELDKDVQDTLKHMKNAEAELREDFNDTNIKTNGNVY